MISARAISSLILQKIYDFNQTLEMTDVATEPQWGTRALRCMFFCLYQLSFWCLLRYDEALKLRCKDVSIIQRSDAQKSLCLRVNVPFRKTEQYGGKLFAMISLCLSHPDIFCFRWPSILLVSPLSTSSLSNECLFRLAGDTEWNPAKS